MPGNGRLLRSIGIYSLRSGEIQEISLVYIDGKREVYHKDRFERLAGMLSSYCLFNEIEAVRELELQLENIRNMVLSLKVIYNKLDLEDVMFLAMYKDPANKLIHQFSSKFECVNFLSEVDSRGIISSLEARIMALKAAKGPRLLSDSSKRTEPLQRILI
jgi:hypothetical protein